MAAFTAALIGLALAGGLATGTKLGQRKAVGDQAPDTGHGPHATLGGAGDTPPAAPPSLALSGSNASVSASNAAARQRKRAAGATLLNGPMLKNPAAAAKSQPASLLGY